LYLQWKDQQSLVSGIYADNPITITTLENPLSVCPSSLPAIVQSSNSGEPMVQFQSIRPLGEDVARVSDDLLKAVGVILDAVVHLIVRAHYGAADDDYDNEYYNDIYLKWCYNGIIMSLFFGGLFWGVHVRWH
jgi:hypothetical protein